MFLTAIPALIVSIILVSIRLKDEKIYKKLIVTAFYTIFFVGVYYFARNATVFLRGNFETGRNRLIWFCLLAGSILYFPNYKVERIAFLQSRVCAGVCTDRNKHRRLENEHDDEHDDKHKDVGNLYELNIRGYKFNYGALRFAAIEAGRMVLFVAISILAFCTQELERLHMPHQIAGALVIILCMAMAAIRYRFKGMERALDIRDIITLFLIAGIYYYFGFAINYRNVSNPSAYVLHNVIILFVVLLWFLFVTANLNITLIIGAIINPVWVLIHYFVYQFRGSIFIPGDIRSTRTAATVAGQYEFYINSEIWRMLAFSLIIILISVNYKKVYVMKKRLAFSVSGTLILTLLIVGVYNTNFIKYFHLPYANYKQDEFYDGVGYTLGFIEVMKKNKVEAPDNYDESVVKTLAAEYGSNLTEAADSAASVDSTGLSGSTDAAGSVDSKGLSGSTDSADTAAIAPNIVVVMNEAFADVGDVGTIETNMDYMPYYHSLETTQDTAVGRTLVSVLGGNTCQSEYEFLTGNSIEFASNIFPYTSEITDNIYSLVTTLKSQGYHAIATHPNVSTNWRRNTVYKCMQFDDMYFIDDYEDSEYIREFVSDKTVFDKILTWIDTDNPQFVFAVTMQNHGGYIEDSIREGEALPIVRKGVTKTEGIDEYLSLIYESDKALEEFIQELDKLERPTVFVMFGDHFPMMTDELLASIEDEGKWQNEFEKSQVLYATPYIVHANYDVDLSSIPEYLSVNYLASNVLNAFGLQMTPFNNYLLDMQKDIPAFNAFGFVTKDGDWYKYSDSYPEEYQNRFNEYNILQYNARYKSAVPEMFGIE